MVNSTRSRIAAHVLWAFVITALISTARPAQAQLTLTPAGVAAGFGLSTFASGFPTSPSSGANGPNGIAFPSSGGVLVTDYSGNVRLFPTDANGQNAASAPIGQFYGDASAVGLAQVGGKIYMTQQVSDHILQINSNGTYNQTIISGLRAPTGIVGDPVDGHLFVSDTLHTIYDIDPIAKTETPFVNVSADGLSLSADGKTLYCAAGDILGYDTKSKALVFDSGAIPGNGDGIALGYGALSGDMFVNTNGGTVYEVNMSTLAKTIIASGGSRGDFATPDPNGTLLLTQSTTLMRLTPPPGGSFEAVPEASTTVSFGLLLTLGLGGVVFAARKKKSQA